jgi:hypothetical protein
MPYGGRSGNEQETPMAERRTKIALPPDNRLHDGSEVPIVTSNERWSEYELEDGSVIRAKVNAIGFVRIDGQYDQEGNPLYAMKSQIVQVIGTVPDRLRRKVN